MLHVTSLLQSFVIYRWDELRSEPALSFRTHADARQWLEGCKGSPMAMDDMRRALQSVGGEPSVLRATDRQVIDELAWQIACHRLHVVPDPVSLPPQDIGHVAPARTAKEPPATGRGRSAASAPPPPEPTTLPTNTDAQALAATLTAAAAAGTPFCEICEKDKQKQKDPAEAAA
jgi:hypothetical protein